VPLTGVVVDAEISTLCARVTVTQRYVNNEATPIEAVYVFPLDEGSAVTGFEAIVDGTLVVGEVKERDEAFKVYDEAMEQGHGAFLLDEERPDVFQASVGNLPPGKEVLLKLTYVSELSIGDGAVRFVVPTTVSPRYAPAEDRSGVGRPDSEALNPPVSWTVPYGLELAVRLAMTGIIGRIESPSHPIAIALNGGQATVTLSQREAALDQDFVLTVEAPALAAPQAWIERDDEGDDAVAMAFAPSLPARVSPAEVIFLVDRSGSMAGTSIEEVRKALQLCLRSLVSGCHFNIIGFGSTTDMLFSQSRPYGEATLAEASAHVSRLQADLGGTEILSALEAAFNQPRPSSLARQVVVVTDGEVTNTDAILAFVRKQKDARVFTFGMGAGPSHHLVRGLARAGGGAAEFIMPGERASAKVTRQLARVLSPALTNVRLEWGGLDVAQAPSVVPPIFGGGRLLVYGFVKTPRADRKQTTVRVLADSASGPVTFETKLDPSQAAAPAHRTVATLAARARIRELEEHPEWIATRGSRQTTRKTNTHVKEIVELSLRYGLMSRETSYVAVERRESPVLGDIQLRRIPVALTSGWGEVTHFAPNVAALSAHAVPMAAGGHFHGAAHRRGPMPRGAGGSAVGRLFGRSRMDETFEFSPARSKSSVERRAEADPMQRLIALQHAGGAWDLSGELAAVIGCRLSDLEKALKKIASATPVTRQAWATALAVAWLERNAGDVGDEWRLLALKARDWLDAVAAVPDGGRSWLDAARQELAHL
jgi:hypothetical protein